MGGVWQRKRRRLAPERRRHELLDVLRAELGRRSFHDVTVPAVAARAGVSQGLFYRYFRDLDDAFVALVEQRVTPRLLASVADLRLDCARAEQVERNLVVWFTGLARLIEDEAPILRATLLAAPSASGVAAEHSRALIETMRQSAEALLRSTQGNPLYRAVDAGQVSQMIVGMTLQCVFHGLGDRTPEQWAREMACFEAWGLMGDRPVEESS